MMCRALSCGLVIGCLTLAGLNAKTAFSALKVTGEGKTQVLAPHQFSGEQRFRFALFQNRCTKCHPMSRVIAALQTGITPVSGGSFGGKDIKKYVVKMMRKPNSGIDKSDAKELVLFLRYARELGNKK